MSNTIAIRATKRAATKRSTKKQSAKKGAVAENGERKYKFKPRPGETFDDFYVRMQAVIYESHRRAREAKGESE